MKNIFIIFIQLLSFIIVNGQNISEKRKLIEQWNKLPDCCIKEYNEKKFKGFLLDGIKLSNSANRDMIWAINKYYSLNYVDSLAFNVRIDTDDVFCFESVLNNMINNNLLINNYQYYPLSLYYRQYLKFKDTLGFHYLLVGFHIEENMNLNSFEHNDNSKEIIAMDVSELNEIIAKKIWISYHNHWNIPDKKHFFIIYNINNQTIEIIK